MKLLSRTLANFGFRSRAEVPDPNPWLPGPPASRLSRVSSASMKVLRSELHGHRARRFGSSSSVALMAIVLALISVWFQALAGGGALEVRKGYFWDPTTARFFYPRGIAYQSWNPPVGANQSMSQVAYDLVEFKKMHANSVRAEMVWNVVETAPGQFDWSKPDFLVQEAERLGLKLFVLVGFQYAPDWFPNEWKAVNIDGERSFVLSYENPHARAAYSNYIAQVTSRYRNSKAIGAWILGNEYAYFDLWEPQRRYLGYDEFSMASYRAYLRKLYGNDIQKANATWGGTQYTSFDAVPMPKAYPADRNNPLFHDLLQWRKHSIGEYVAVGARAARQSDPNHLLTYSMIGGLFGEQDQYYTCEDGRTIVRSCAEAGAPLDFWCINNYAIASLDTELRSGDFGIGKHQAATGLPVLLSETGHTSTENLHEGASARQAAALPTQLWEAVMSGAMGVHIFTWNDRDFFSGDYFPREKGFGIVEQTRLIKDPVFLNVQRVFERMDELAVGDLLGGSTNPPNDIQIYWSRDADMGWARANHELNRLWLSMKRLGYQPGIIHDEEFEAGAWRSARALLVSRAFQMNPAHLETLATSVIDAGVNVLAATDLPGQFNAYHQPNPKWRESMNRLFGLEVANAVPALDGGALVDNYRDLTVVGKRAFGSFPAGYRDSLSTWKYWQGLSAVRGDTIVNYSGSQPGLHLNQVGAAKTAAITLAIGDSREAAGQRPPHSWDLRYQWLHAVLRDHFGIVPPLDLTGPGSQYVFPDYRVCRNGSVLIGVFNGHTNAADVVIHAAGLLAGMTVENLTDGGVLQVNSPGEIGLHLAGDQYVLLYATRKPSDSLINPSSVKLWFESPPSSVWPKGEGIPVTVGYDTQGATMQLSLSFGSTGLSPKTYGTSSATTIHGQGTATLVVPVPDADLNDPRYRSSRDGGDYLWHAMATGTGVAPSYARVPVRLLWGVRPTSLPSNPRAGGTYPITVNWEELPGYLPEEAPTALDRALNWDSLATGRQHDAIILEALSAGTVVAQQEFVTDRATGSHEFQLTLPASAKGPITWQARAQTSEGSSDDLVDSFEGRHLGADSALPKGAPSLLSPWTSYNYAQNGGVGSLYLDVGSQLTASEGSQSAFLVFTNPPTVGAFSGFGLSRDFPTPLALPPTLDKWRDYTFSCDVREASGHLMNVGLQVKSPNAPGEPVRAIQYLQTGVSARDGWVHVSARLDQFQQPDFFGLFDILNATTLVVNFEMLEKGVIYVVSLDNIRFDAPERTGLPGVVQASYRSDNDSAAPLPDADGDGIPNAFETGTGTYRGPTDTGTSPTKADSDGDGQSDGDELVAGTDPNVATDVFRVDSVRWDEAGFAVLRWPAKAGRFYSVSFADELAAAPGEYFPVPGLTALSTTVDGMMEVVDPSPLTGRFRCYRVTVLKP